MSKSKQVKKAKKPTICLNMIVKDEAHIIERCLKSVMPHIDTWVISDTGSTDGTQDMIRKILKDIPGELVEHEWRDFGHNRNRALEAAAGKADYIFIMDADDWFETEDGFEFGNLSADACHLTKRNDSRQYWVPNVIRNDAGWVWEGVLHECLVNTQGNNTEEQIHGAFIESRREGARSLDPMKYHKDAALLTRALTEEPDNTRYQFYLAQSWRDAGDMEQAITHYQRRAEMGGWREEVFYSMYQKGMCMEHAGREFNECLTIYLEACEHTPERAEALYRIGANYFDMNKMQLAYLFLSQAATLPLPSELLLFIEPDIYNFKAAYFAAVAAERLERTKHAVRFYSQVVDYGEEGNPFFDEAKNGLERCGEESSVEEAA